MIRKQGGNARIDDDQGNSYLPPGGGINPAGFSILPWHRRGSADPRSPVGRANAEAIADAIEGARKVRPTDLRLRFLQFDAAGRMEVAEDNHGAQSSIPAAPR
jgi:hypothetical protein